MGRTYKIGASVIESAFLLESNKIEEVYDDDSFIQAVFAWNYLKSKDNLTIGVILKTHKILMLHQKLRPSEKGYFRTVPVWVGGREGIEWKKINEAIHHWLINVKDLLANGKNESPEYLERIIKKHHVEYERIHGFIDGNGRTGRMFMNWERLKLGLPILVINANERRKYYEWFS